MNGNSPGLQRTNADENARLQNGKQGENKSLAHANDAATVEAASGAQ